MAGSGRVSGVIIGLRYTVLSLLALGAASCAGEPTNLPLPEAYLHESGRYQALYSPEGEILRLLYDGNGDKTADVVTLFYPDGKPRQVEIDTDHDGIVDRWQYFSLSRTLEKEGTARRKPGTPDVWEYRDTSGLLIRRDLDEDADETVDRIEYLEAGQPVLVVLDSDRDGRSDRWQTWTRGRLVREDLDTDGDEVADRRLRYADSGDVIALDVLEGTTQLSRPKDPLP